MHHQPLQYRIQNKWNALTNVYIRKNFLQIHSKWKNIISTGQVIVSKTTSISCLIDCHSHFNRTLKFAPWVDSFKVNYTFWMATHVQVKRSEIGWYAGHKTHMFHSNHSATGSSETEVYHMENEELCYAQTIIFSTANGISSTRWSNSFCCHIYLTD